MTIIKPDQVDADNHRLDMIEIEDFDRRASELIAQAEEAARGIIEAAREEASRVLETARKEGWNSGDQAGREEGLQQGRKEAHAEHTSIIKSLCDGWTTMLQGWEEDRALMFREAQQDVLRLAIQLAERIVHRTARLDGTVVRSQIEAAMGLIRHQTDVQIVISPDDEAVVSEILGDVVETVSNCRDVSIQVDPNMAPGGCRLALDGGSIDASLESQLEHMVTLLLPDEHMNAAGLNGADT